MKARIKEIRSPDAPVEISAVVFVTDGEQTGKVTITFGMGVIPSVERIIDKIKSFSNEELKGMLDGNFRLMTSDEFFHACMYEKLGTKEEFAVPRAYEKFNFEI